MAILQKLGDEAICPLTGGHVRIGRAKDNEIVIEDESVSGYHALITIRKAPHDPSVNQYILEDLDSTNKTYVNSKLINNHILNDGDIIRIGLARLKFSTRDYTPPQTDFQKTTRLSPYKSRSFTLKK